MTADLPILYTFRRCPYAMRARWALQAAGVAGAMREIVLRDKPPAMLAASPKGTVPVLVLPGGAVIDESLEVMRWALAQNDPHGWLTPERGTLDDMLALIAACERDFKPHLDRSKYASRFRAEYLGRDRQPFGGARRAQNGLNGIFEPRAHVHALRNEFTLRDAHTAHHDLNVHTLRFPRRQQCRTLLK